MLSASLASIVTSARDEEGCVWTDDGCRLIGIVGHWLDEDRSYGFVAT
jgi:hypothetical protein